MKYICGIYGFDITRPIQLPAALIEPVFESSQAAEEHARDQRSYRLTAVLRGDRVDAQFCFDLAAVLSFIEGLDVAITNPEDLDVGPPPPLPSILMRQVRHSSGGASVGRDTFFGGSREQFVQLAMTRLQDQAFCEATQFRTLLFHCVEAFRQRQPFIELTWFLLFTALESHARTVQNMKRGTVPPILSKTLQSYGLAVVEHDPNDLHRSMSTYARLRNALFHSASREAKTSVGGSVISLRMTDYLYNLEKLVALTVLKMAGFDDGHINWNSWLDRMPFK